MKIMLMKIKDGMIVASHIMATGIDLEIYSDIMGIIDTFGHAHYFHNVNRAPFLVSLFTC